MEVSAHIDALRDEGELMAAAVDRADPGAAVPTCPEWTMRDLVRHTGGVHRWATGYVADARTEVRTAGLDEIVGTWPDDTELAGWFRQGFAALVTALTTAPADLDCWTFFPRPLRSPCGPVGRRTRRRSIGSTPSWRRTL